MKKLTRKLIDYLFYNFMVDILEENFRVKISGNIVTFSNNQSILI